MTIDPQYVWRVTHEGRTYCIVSNQITPTDGFEKMAYYHFDHIDSWGSIVFEPRFAGTGNTFWYAREHSIALEYIGETWYAPEEG